MEFKKITTMIENFGKNHASYWGCALAGETGEACNLIKKHERDGAEIVPKLAMELADVFIYLELTARYFEIDLELAIIIKTAIVNHKREMMNQGNEMVDCKYCKKKLEIDKEALIIPGFTDEENIPTYFYYFCDDTCLDENEAEEQALGSGVMGGY